MTPNEKALVAALEADIATWEQEANFFEKLVQRVDMTGGDSMPGREYAQGIRQRITDHRALIEKVKNG